MKSIAVVAMAVFFCSPLAAVEFRVPVTGDVITYRFVPQTGTLRDLTARNGSGFEFYPSNYGGIERFALAGVEMWSWEGRHSTVFLGESFGGGVYTARFRYEFSSDALEFTVVMRVENKSLVVEYRETTPGDKVRRFGFDRSEQTPDPKVIKLPYGHHVMWSNGLFVSGVIDQAVSQAAWLHPTFALYSGTSAYFGDEVGYEPLTSGARRSLFERMYLTVSPEISDTFWQPPNPVSSYRDQLANRVVLDLWRYQFSQCHNDIATLAGMELRDLLVIVHHWQKYGYDIGLPSSYPACEHCGGHAQLQQVSQLCARNGYLFALHTNYVDFYENSDVWNVADVALNPDGTWVRAWYNQWAGLQSYLIKPTRALYYAQMYEPQIHAGYFTTASFLDVHTAVLPGFKVDFDAAAPGSGMMSTTFEKYRELLAYARSVHQGPLSGEGFGFSARVWAGHVDAIEADPRSLDELSNNRGGSEVPLLVDYKLRALHRLFVPHGAGYLERFYFDKWNNYTTEELERYRATQIAFGNAGFLHDPFHKNIPSAEVKRDYCFLKHIQQRAIPANATDIEYHLGGSYRNLSSALGQLLPGTDFNAVDRQLRNQLSRLRITYDNGLVIYVNRSGGDWQLQHGGKSYRLPPNGFVASGPGGFLAYYASENNGAVQDYICPAEGICSTCPGCASGQPCDDGNPCTHSDHCNSQGRCGGVAYSCTPAECQAASTCDGQGGCRITPAADGTVCADEGNPCTSDICQRGVCVHPQRANGTACNDGNLCTQTDTCQNGVCAGSNPVVCAALSQCHDIGTCQPATGICNTPPKPSGSACDDGNSCTHPDGCDGQGVCRPGPNTCANCQDRDGDGYGNPASSACMHPQADCHDDDHLVHPGASERCNNLDDNCSGQTDELWPELGRECRTGMGICQATGKLVCAPSQDGTRCDALPGTPGTEICGNDKDEDCDGSLDNGCLCNVGDRRSCYTGPPGTAGVGVCRSGEQICENGVWGSCEGQFTPGWESCHDGLDTDCDRLTDGDDDDCAIYRPESGCSCGHAAGGGRRGLDFVVLLIGLALMSQKRKKTCKKTRSFMLISSRFDKIARFVGAKNIFNKTCSCKRVKNDTVCRVPM